MEGMARASEVLALLGLGRLKDAATRVVLLESFAGRVHIRLWTSTYPLSARCLSADGRAEHRTTGFTEQGPAPWGCPIQTWNQADMALMEIEQGKTTHGVARCSSSGHPAKRTALIFRSMERLARAADRLHRLDLGDSMPLSSVESEVRKVRSASGGAPRRRGHDQRGPWLDRRVAGRPRNRSPALREAPPVQGIGRMPLPRPRGRSHPRSFFPPAGGQCYTTRGITSRRPLRSAAVMASALELGYTCRDYAEFCLLDSGAKADEQKARALYDEAVAIRRKGSASSPQPETRAAPGANGAGQVRPPTLP